MKRFRLTVLMILVLVGCFAACAYADLTPVPITVNTDTPVTFAGPGDAVLFSFTPTQTGRYIFRSFNNEDDPYGYLFDDEMEQIDSSDDYDDRNFRIEATLTAGYTYYLGVRNFNEKQTGGMTVRLDRLEGLVVNSWQAFVYCTRNQSQYLYAEAVSDAGGVTWQWYQVTDGQEQAIAGATEMEYFFPPLTENRIYRCKVSDAQGRTQTVEYDVRIDPKVELNMNWIETEVEYNGSYTYTAEATAEYGELSYCWQWYRLNELTGEWEYVTVSNQARMAATEICESREYVCRVTDVNGRTYEGQLYIRPRHDNFTLTADSETSFNVPAGQEITMKVHPLTDSDPYHYSYFWEHWSPNDEWSEIETYGPTATVPARDGRYICYVDDGCGNYTSIAFDVTATSDMTASADGESNLTVAPNTPVTMKVNASSSAGGITYQWYQYSKAFERYIPISGTNSATYAIAQAKSAGRYRCRATDAAGVTSTVDFTLDIVNHLFATQEGDGFINLAPGATATMKVTADSDDHNVFYRWYTYWGNGGNMTRIAGADSDSLTVTGTGLWTYYRCKVYDAWGNSANFYWDVGFNNNLRVSPEEEEITAVYNGSATMTVTATANLGELNYRWYRIAMDPMYGETGRWPVEGTYGNSLTISPVTEAAYYRCVVADEYDNTASASFTIRIDNGLTVAADGPTEFSVAPTEPVTMKVSAGCTNGEMTYQWYRYDTLLEGETGSSLAILSATNNDSGSYRCVVTDEYGNTGSVYFSVGIDNNLTIRYLTPSTVYPAPDGTTTMTVQASCSVGDVAYAWEKGVRTYDDYGYWYWSFTALSETGPSLTVTDASNEDKYVCHATDAYGSSTSLQFYVSIPDNGNIWIQSVVYNADEPGGEAMVSLSVWSSQGPLTYTWYRRDGDEGEQTQIQGVTGPQLIIQNVTSPIDIQCEISNKTGMTTYSCTVAVDIHLEISSKNPSTKLLGPNETETLTVTATSNDNQLTYQWSKNGVRLENVTGNSLQISGQDEPGYYECVVNASYGNSQQYDFYRATATEGATLALNQTVNAEITEHCRIRAFSFTPTESGEYSFYSDSERDTYGYLFNDEYEMITYNDDGGYGTNFLITRELAAGETVYLAVRYYSILGDPGTIPVGVMTGEYRIEKDGGTLYLHEGQSAYLPEDYRNSDSFDSAESGNGQVLAVNGRRITAGTAGQTTLHARYNEIQVNYTVIVEDTGVFALPEELEEIEDEAFAGVTIQYLEVEASVYNIYNGRFSGTGIHQALFRGDDTVISDGALGSEPFTIICYPNSQAYYYAQNHNCPWLSLE